jgi:hypothetical protein
MQSCRLVTFKPSNLQTFNSFVAPRNLLNHQAFEKFPQGDAVISSGYDFLC